MYKYLLLSCYNSGLRSCGMIKKYLKLLWLLPLLVTFSLAEDNRLESKQLDQDTTLMFQSTDNPQDFDPSAFVGSHKDKKTDITPRKSRQFGSDDFSDGSLAGTLRTNDIYLGIRYTNPSFGLSVKMDLSNELAVQAIIDFIGDINLYEGKGIYRFDSNQDFDLYVYGSVGFWVYNYTSTNSSYESHNYRTSFGFGAGFGAEFNLENFDEKLPPLLLSTELGLRMVNLEHYHLIPISFELGLHYKF